MGRKAAAMSVGQSGDDQFVIDLDVARSEPPVEAATLPRLRLRQRRWLLVATALVLVLGLAAGAERQRDLAPVFQLSGEAQQAQLSDGVLFVTPMMRNIVRAYEMPRGRLLWSRPSVAESGRAEWRAYGDVLVLAVTNAAGGLRNLETIDGRTGRTLWKLDRAALIGGAGNILVVGQLFATAAADAATAGGGGAEDGGSRVAGRLVGLDRRTGAEIWTQPLSVVDVTAFVGDTAAGAETSTATDHAAGYVVATSTDGSTRAYQAATGRDASETEVATAMSRVGSPGFLRIGGNGLPVGIGTCTVLLYGAVARQHWRKGSCLPDSVLRWTTPQVTGSRTTLIDQDRLVVVDGRPAVTGASDAAGSGTSDASGSGLPGWSQVGSAAGGRQLVLASTEAKGGRVLALLDAEDGVPRVLGRESNAIGRPTCQGADGYLLCRGVRGLGVWRLPHRR